MGTDLMLTIIEGYPGRYRGVIIAGDAEDQGTWQRIFDGPWCTTERTAQMTVMQRYWPTYEERNGFKHPMDPSRTPSDPAPARTIVSMEGGMLG
jgi:hypothetical protein